VNDEPEPLRRGQGGGDPVVATRRVRRDARRQLRERELPTAAGGRAQHRALAVGERGEALLDHLAQQLRNA